MDFSPCFSSEAKYIRFGLFWVVLCFFSLQSLSPRANCYVFTGQGDQLRVMTWGLWAFVELQGHGFWGELPTAGSEAGPPPRCAILGFLFTSVVILSFTIQVPLFFSPFLPVLSTGKLLRGLIRSCFWDLFPCSLGWVSECFPSYLRWRTTVLFLS